jgi:hypothetical protein
MVEQFSNYILKLINFHAPEKTVKVTYKPALWRTKEIINLEQKRDALLAKFKKTKNPHDFTLYQKIRNKTGRVSRDSRITKTHEQLDPTLPPRIRYGKTLIQLE